MERQKQSLCGPVRGGQRIRVLSKQQGDRVCAGCGRKISPPSEVFVHVRINW